MTTICVLALLSVFPIMFAWEDYEDWKEGRNKR